MLRKKCFLMSFQGHPRSIKVIWLNQFFCIPIGYHMVKNDGNMKMSYKDMPIYALNLAIWAHLAPQCVLFIPNTRRASLFCAHIVFTILDNAAW